MSIRHMIQFNDEKNAGGEKLTCKTIDKIYFNNQRYFCRGKFMIFLTLHIVFAH